VAEKVLRKAARLVLTVPPGPNRATADRPFRTIVCAVDLSHGSGAVVDTAANFATRYGADLIVLNIVDWPFDTADAPAPDWKASLERRAEDRLAQLVADHCGTWIKASSRVLTGTPTEEILTSARTHHADLIVLGVSGHGAVERAVLGSTAHAVVRRSVCPVLTVPAGLSVND
jgi:nucleotide-binding universal stress UspA family protein